MTGPNRHSEDTHLVTTSTAPTTLEELKIVHQALDEKHGEDIRLLDLTQVSDTLQYFVICTANSQPQLNALESNLSDKLKEVGLRPVAVEGPSSRWVLVNLGAIIVHLMSAEARAFYDLEGLWADAEPVTL